MEDFGFAGPMGDETPFEEITVDFDEYDDYDGQPDEAQEWADYYGGDEDPGDWDQFGGAFE